MEHHVGIDVSLELSSVCVLDAAGKIVREAKVASEPEALVAFLRGLGLPVARVGLEAGPLSQWLYDGLHEAGFETVLLETRHVKAALSAMPVKTDRRAVRGIAQLLRMGWFRPVHRKSVPSQEVRALLGARKQQQRSRESGSARVVGGGGLRSGLSPLRATMSDRPKAYRPRISSSIRRSTTVDPDRSRARQRKTRRPPDGADPTFLSWDAKWRSGHRWLRRLRRGRSCGAVALDDSGHRVLAQPQLATDQAVAAFLGDESEYLGRQPV